MCRLSIVILLFSLLSACEEPMQVESGDSHFERHIVRPNWFFSLEAPALNTIKAVDTLWRSKKRCCTDKETLIANNREFYKGCYLGIVNNPKFEELVVKCLWLMDAGADKTQRELIKTYLVENYSHHKNNTTCCANCAPADTVARVTHELARIKHSKGNTDAAIELVEEIINRRRQEISPWVQTEIFTTLGRYYALTRVTDDRAQRITDAYQRLSANASEGNGVLRRIENLKKINLSVVEALGQQ